MTVQPDPAHTPVMRDAAVAALNLAAGDCVVDATCGGGGHARAILGRLRELGPGGRLLAIDRDAEAVECARLALGDGDGDGDLSRHPRSDLSRHPRSPHPRHPRSLLSGGGDGDVRGGDGDGDVDGARARLTERGRGSEGDRGRDGDAAQVEIIHARFSRLGEILESRGLRGRVAGILFDFGVSSMQLDAAARGFSFQAAGPLDMRMDASEGPTAADWLARVDEKALAVALREFGEERFARPIARAIKRAMARGGRIADTVALAQLVADAMPRRTHNPRKVAAKHPATRAFQAIRIAVNDELGEARRALPQAVDGLRARGRLVVISFHSLEDRLVKRFMREGARGDPYPPEAAIPESWKRPTLRLVGKPRRPTAAEVDANRRARSAVMRVAEKLELPAAPATVATATVAAGAM